MWFKYLEGQAKLNRHRAKRVGFIEALSLSLIFSNINMVKKIYVRCVFLKKELYEGLVNMDLIYIPTSA